MAISFEAKKHAWRQTQDGIVVSFVLHPQEINPEFAVAALGTRYMVAVEEIGDDEKPKVAAQKERTPFKDLPLSQQAAIKCTDEEFQRWLGHSDEGGAASYVRLLCGVESRSEIKAGTKAGKEWLALLAQYEAYQTTQRYADAIR